VRNIERTGSIARAIAYATGASSGAKMVYSGYKRGRDAVTEYFQTKRLRRDRGENIFPQGSLIKNMPRYGKGKYGRRRRRRYRRRKRRYKKRRESMITKMLSPPFNGYYEMITSIYADFDESTIYDFTGNDTNVGTPASMDKNVHRSTQQIDEIADYYQNTDNYAFESANFRLVFDFLKTNYLLLNPGNAPVIVDWWIVTPKHGGSPASTAYLAPVNTLERALANVDGANPGATAGARTQAAITDVQFYPNQVPAWRESFKTIKKGKTVLGPDQSTSISLYTGRFQQSGLGTSYASGTGVGNDYWAYKTKFLVVKIRGVIGSLNDGTAAPGTNTIGYNKAQIDVMVRTKFRLRKMPQILGAEYGKPVLGGHIPNASANKLYTNVDIARAVSANAT
jgi:hypothetical protein